MKKILITGCGRGLGKCLYDELINRDQIVIPHYREDLDTCSSNGIAGDINDYDVYNFIGSVAQRNDIDIFINNAAIHSYKSLLEYSDDEITKMLNTNLVSQILITKRIYKIFKAKNKGLIVNINSLAGKSPSVNESIYCASKHGLDGFSKSLQLECVGTGIHIKDFYIGAMKTDMSKWREDYEVLMEPKEVASFISDAILNEYNSLKSTEYTIRKK